MSISPPQGNVKINGWAEYAVKLVVRSVIEIGWYVTPLGTETTIEVELDDIILAATEPKNTILLEGMGLKLLPLMVTDVPTVPEYGETDTIRGCAFIILFMMKSIMKMIRFFFICEVELIRCRNYILISMM